MSSTIKVDTSVITTTATKIEGYITDYEQSYKAVEKLSEEVDATWDGTDNDKFKEQLAAFNNDFVDLKNKLDDYVAFLKKAVEQYDAAQDKLTQDAGNLAANR